jgi:hypothetical protein
MSSSTNYNPSLYQINTRIWLRTMSVQADQLITLGNVPDSELDRLTSFGFDWIWLLGVWQTGEIGRQIALEHPDLQQEYLEVLPDLHEQDICGSPFATTGYSVSPDLGGNHGLAIFREKLHSRGIKLMLDFIPNHTAHDHPWTTLHPDYYIQGSEDQLQREPFNFGRLQDDDKIFAFGRDPYFPGWSDTFQLNYGNPGLQTAMGEELLNISEVCDGVRCDMAMLLLPEVYQRTWGIEIEAFWPKAIDVVKAQNSGFTFMAEVYWDLEWELQEQGFDYTYDKRLYDRLLKHEVRSVREHLMAGMEFQNKSARFMENHDEPRAAKSFPLQVHQAAAVITYLTPGMKFFHQGQLQGHLQRIPMQICRAPREQDDPEIVEFYDLLIEILQLPILQLGDWQLLDCFPAWGSNWTWDNFVAFAWGDFQDESLLIVVNYAPHQGQCYVRLPEAGFGDRDVLLVDQFSGVNYARRGDDLTQFGLCLDMPAWPFHVFEVRISE